MLYGVFKQCTDSEQIAQKALDLILNSKPAECINTGIFADLDYFETLKYGKLRELAAGDKEVSKCLTESRTYLFKQRTREEELKVVNG